MNTGKIFVIAVLLLSFFVLPENAAAKYSGGQGTVIQPYEINAPVDLLVLGADVNDYGKFFMLTADINLASAGSFGAAVIAPDVNNEDAFVEDVNKKEDIFDGNAFTGVFDGTGHKIINLTIDTNGAPNSYLGLFGRLRKGSQVINLGLENVSITSGNGSVYIGGLAGKSDAAITSCYSKNTITCPNNTRYIGGLVGDNNSGSISSCFTTGTIISGANSYNIGGLAGDSNSGAISNCYTRGDVGSEANSYNIGGLLGQLYAGSISKCNTRGDVSGEANSYNVGGLAGQIYGGSVSKSNSQGDVRGAEGAGALGGLVGDNRGTISNCYALGDVNGGDDIGTLGGLVGYTTGSISYSYAAGNITAGDNSSFLGGLTGINAGTISNCYSTGNVGSEDDSLGIGGLTGGISGTLTNCYSTGAVTSGSNPSNIGGLVGQNSSSTITYCYFLDTSGPHNNYGFSLTGRMMKQQNSYFSWNFFGKTANDSSSLWWINQSRDYPRLNWQMAIDRCTVTAGRKDNSDKISISGRMYTTYTNITGAGSIIVTISSDDIVNRFTPSFPVVSTTFSVNARSGRYRYRFSGNDGNIRKSFTYDSSSRKFSFAASNVDLSGLDAPVNVAIDISGYTGMAEVNEIIVNGRARPIPILLMMGVKDVLRVDRCQVRQGRTLNSDQLTAKGAFAVEDTDVNMADFDLVITLGTDTWTLPAGSLRTGRGMFSCSNVPITGGTVSATFNFNSCSFTLTIKNANIIADPGDTVNFGLSFADFSQTQEVTLP